MSETTTETIPNPPAEPRRLTRTRDGRWLGGVCAGLGRYFDLNPAIYRVAFVALALAGGTGILLYIAAWLVIPDETVEDSIAAEALKQHRDRPWLLIGVGLLAFGTIVGLSEARFWSSPGNLWLAAALAGAAIVWWHVGTASAAPRPPGAGGGAVATGPPPPRRRSLFPVTVGLLIGAFGVIGLVDAVTSTSVDWRIVLAASAVATGALVALGAATGHAVGAVAALGLALLCALALALAIRVPVFAGFGDHTEHPATFAAVDSRYRLGIGDYRVDLHDVSFPAGETHVKATLGIGNLVVRVPEDVTVDVDAHASAGQVRLFDHSEDGTSVHDHVYSTGTKADHVLVLDARVGFGEVEVRRG